MSRDYLPAWRARGLAFDDTVVYAGTPLAGDQHALLGVPVPELVSGLVTEDGTRILGVLAAPQGDRFWVYESRVARRGVLRCWRTRNGIRRYVLRADDVVVVRAASARRIPPRGVTT